MNYQENLVINHLAGLEDLGDLSKPTEQNLQLVSNEIQTADKIEQRFREKSPLQQQSSESGQTGNGSLNFPESYASTFKKNRKSKSKNDNGTQSSAASNDNDKVTDLSIFNKTRDQKNETQVITREVLPVIISSNESNLNEEQIGITKQEYNILLNKDPEETRKQPIGILDQLATGTTFAKQIPDKTPNSSKVTPYNTNESQISTQTIKNKLNKHIKNNMHLRKKSIKQSAQQVSQQALNMENRIHKIDKSIPGKENMKNYMEDYSMSIDVPSLYVQDAKFFKTNPEYCLKILNVVNPQSQDTIIQNHWIDKKNKNQTLSKDINEDLSQGLILRLIKTSEKRILILRDILIKKVHFAKINFSFDGKFLVMFYKDLQQIKVCKIDQIQELLPQIQNGQYHSEYDGLATQDISFINHVEIDYNNNYVIGRGDKKAFIFHIQSMKAQFYNLDKKLYEKIYNIRLVSNSKQSYRCQIACKKKDVKQVHIFEMFGTDEESKKLKVLNFQHEDSDLTLVDISFDFKQIVFVNKAENFEIADMGTYYVQRNLNQLKNKIVRYISHSPDLDGFYFVAHLEYDQYLDVDHSKRTDFLVDFQRDIEPGIIKIFDFVIIQKSEVSLMLKDTSGSSLLPDINERSYSRLVTANGRSISKEIKLISLRDDDFIIDSANYNEQLLTSNGARAEQGYADTMNNMNKKYKTENIVYNQFQHKSIGSFCISWPYLAFCNMNRFLVIWNVFENKTLHVVEVGDLNSNLFVEDAYITQTNDLILVTRVSENYSIYLIDLDESNINEFEGQNFDYDNQFKLKLLFNYKSEDVNYKPLSNIHARGSSRKEAVDTNNKLVVFLLHEKNLYSWVQLQENSQNQEAFRFVGKFHSKEFMLLDDSKFVYLENFYDQRKEVTRQEIKCVQINFSTYSIMTIHHECQPEMIISINLDQISNKLIIFQDVQSTQDSIEKKKFKILDFDNMKILFESMIKDKPLIGRLASGMYTFVDGHIYYNNNVIKIRYDIINHLNSQKYTEYEIFDFYFNIFKLRDNETVKASTPLDSFRSHKFGYVISNSKDLKPKRVMITPYLHDTRIYLNRIKINTEYFYTSIETYPTEGLFSNHITEHKISEPIEDDDSSCMLESKGLADDEANQIETKHLAPVDIQKSVTDQKDSQLTFTSILCFNLTEHKYYIYSQSGILLNRVNFQSSIDMYGIPKSVFSSNGRVFIFQKSYEQIQNETKSKEELLRQILEINIMQANIDKFNFICEISLYDLIQKYVPDDSCLKKLQVHDDFIEMIDIAYAINNKTDVVIRLREKPQDHNTDGDRDHNHKKDVLETSYYFYIKHNLDASGHQSVQMIEDLDKIEDFTINDEFIFIWSKKQIKYFPLDANFKLECGDIIDLKIENQDSHINIIEIRSGSDPNQLIVIIDQSLDKLMLFRWDVKYNRELDQQVIDRNYRLVWDKKGNPYILMKDRTLIFEQNCYVTCYGKPQFGMFVRDRKSFQNGHRFDHKNHNWVIQQEYLDLPFSYMTFVILDKIERKDTTVHQNVFDPVPFNYIYNRRNFFLNSDFVKKDHVMLGQILQNLHETNPVILDLINYTQKIQIQNPNGKSQEYVNSALGIAHHEGNNKAVELLLKYLSKNKGGQSISDYVQLFPQLLQYKNFVTYLKSLPIRNFQMERKQILQVEGQINDQIVKITDYHCSYIDQKFFNENMDEDINNEQPTNNIQNIKKIKRPVDIQAVQIDWVLSNEGKRFLVSILNNQNLDYYSISSLQMIIEFLFSTYKRQILSSSFPLFVAQVLTFFLQIQANESAHFAMRHTLPNQIVYNQYRATLPKTIFNWSDETQMSFSAFAKQLLIILNIITALIQFIELKSMAKFILGSWGQDQIKWRPIILDLIFIFVTLTIDVQVVLISIYTDVDNESDYYQTRIRYMFYIRLESLIIIPLLFIKIVNIFTLFDQISPFVDIVFKIFSDIMFFMFIFVITIVSTAQCFYIIGQNQIWFDNITMDEYNNVEVRYDTIINSLWYVWLLTLGEFNYDSFFIGNQGQMIFLIFIFVISTFLMIVHLLNMLIAIMGSTYMSRSEVAHNIRTRDHLKFVIENWHLKSKFKELDKMKYIICAFVDHQFTGQDDNVEKMTEEIHSMQKIFRQNQELTMIQQNELNNQIIILNKKMESVYKHEKPTW